MNRSDGLTARQVIAKLQELIDTLTTEGGDDVKFSCFLVLETKEKEEFHRRLNLISEGWDTAQQLEHAVGMALDLEQYIDLEL